MILLGVSIIGREAEWKGLFLWGEDYSNQAFVELSAHFVVLPTQGGGILGYQWNSTSSNGRSKPRIGMLQSLVPRCGDAGTRLL